MTGPIECLLDCRCELGEGMVWDDATGTLWWVDIVGQHVHALERGSGRHKRWSMPGQIGTLGLIEGEDALVVALPDGVYRFDLKSERLDLIVDPEPDRPANRLNDGKVGPDGALWVGSMHDVARDQREPIAALYRVSGDGRAERKVDGLIVSNGIGWTADGRTMFHSDSSAAWIDRHDFDPSSGVIANRTRFADLDATIGRPDGAAVDEEGCYWSCGVSAGCINRFDPNGTLVETIALPVPAPTICCFGDADMKTLFVTSLRQNVPDQALAAAPWSGSILTMRTTVAGVPTWRFKA